MGRNLLDSSEFGYVIYKQPKKPEDNKWEEFRESKENSIRKAMSKTKDYFYGEDGEKVVETLRHYASKERTKEDRIIAALLAKDTSEVTRDVDQIKFVNKFNEVMQGRRMYRKQLENLASLTKDGTVLDKDDQEILNNGKGVIARSFTTIFTSKLKTELGHRAKWFVEQYYIASKGNNEQSKYEQYVKQNGEAIIKKALYDTIEYLSHKDNIWAVKFRGLKKILDELSKSVNLFETISNVYLNPLIKLLQEKWEDIDLSREKYKMFGKKAIDDLMRGSSFGMSTSGAAGFIDEAVTAEFIKMVQKAKGGVDIQARALKTNNTKIDSVVVFNFDNDIEKNVLKRIDEVFKEKISTKGMNEALEIARKEFRKLEKDNDYVLYINNKLYGLEKGGHFRGFGGGEERKISDFEKILQLNKLSPTRTKEVLNYFYQLADGAIFEDDFGSGDAHLNATYLIAKNVANLLFDEWEYVGKTAAEQTKPNSIHAFSLNGVLIPLSYFLYAIADAIEDTTKDMNSVLKVDLYVLREIDYKQKKGKYDYGDAFKNASSLQDADAIMRNLWNEQRNRAIENTKFSITFLKKFYDIVDEAINYKKAGY